LASKKQIEELKETLIPAWKTLGEVEKEAKIYISKLKDIVSYIT